ncbi:RNA 2',3'-cyclic phosphodiesterase [Solimonas sp. K1W22B-7]|uniref:RNA 2',3'-cyclic phosphodiesterase n=1 Tax=Solimonas sp. K1W22B-7 TaxID=2303331 RepID=UPI000E336C64|nr:RNA 2',3'-cyclic phosphodiesterase [Solimonas sp. K1W22B-7]AXQ30255.1 RNA 2',3'-cyclic phosphodiesterase [Solimonas sp. K1W22B-7]
MLKLNRLFFALWPGEAERRACDEAARELRLKMQPGGYLSSPERYHITLLFLGDTVSPESEAAALRAAAKVRAAPFALNLELASSFRANRKIPWWLGSRETPPGLTQLYERINEAMLAARVLPERMKFVPHLTVLRDARIPLPATPIRPVAWNVDEFVLLRSRLDQKPMSYEILGRWALDGTDEPPAPAQQQLGLF